MLHITTVLDPICLFAVLDGCGHISTTQIHPRHFLDCEAATTIKGSLPQY